MFSLYPGGNAPLLPVAAVAIINMPDSGNIIIDQESVALIGWEVSHDMSAAPLMLIVTVLYDLQ